MSGVSEYREIVCVSEDEMWEMTQTPITGTPKFYAVSKNGMVRFHPRLPDATKIRLLCAIEGDL